MFILIYILIGISSLSVNKGWSNKSFPFFWQQIKYFLLTIEIKKNEMQAYFHNVCLQIHSQFITR